MKKFDLVPILPYKSSWKFNRKNKCSEILNNWKITFQASDNKERYFLDLLDDNFNSIELTYTKGGLWLKFFDHSNSLCTRATRAITNHAPIGEYWLRFLLQEEFIRIWDEIQSLTLYSFWSLTMVLSLLEKVSLSWFVLTFL